MKFHLTIEGDTSSPSDMRVVREISALLNSTAAGNPNTQPFTGMPAPIQPQPVPVVSDDDDTAPAPGTFNPGEVDKNGLPWDERIHAKSRSKIGDGSWRQRRGVDPNVVTAVEAELRQRMAAGGQQPAPVAPMPQPVPVAQPQPMPMPQPVPVAQPAPMPVPVQQQPAMIPQPVVTPPTAVVPMPVAQPAPAPVPVAQPEAAPVVDFGFVMQALQRSLQAGKADGNYIAALTAELQVADMNALNGDNQKCWQAYQAMVRDGKYV